MVNAEEQEDEAVVADAAVPSPEDDYFVWNDGY